MALQRLRMERGGFRLCLIWLRLQLLLLPDHVSDGELQVSHRVLLRRVHLGVALQHRLLELEVRLALRQIVIRMAFPG